MPSIDVRPTWQGINVIVRYITRANERYEVRNFCGRNIQVRPTFPVGQACGITCSWRDTNSRISLHFPDAKEIER